MSVESELNNLTASVALLIEQTMQLDSRVRELFSTAMAEEGILVFNTKADMLASTGTEEGTQARVYGDTPENNGVYLFKSGTWALDDAFYAQLSRTVQPILDQVTEEANKSNGYAQEAKDALAAVQAIAASLPALTAINFTATPHPVEFSADSTGRLISYEMSDGSLSISEAPKLLSAIYGRSPAYVGAPQYVTGTSDPIAGPRAGINPVTRIPLLFRCPNGRIVLFYQGRANTDDYSASNITMLTREPGSKQWSAERIILQQSATSYHIENISVVYDPVTRRHEFLVGASPRGTTEHASVDPVTDPIAASGVFSFYSADNCQTFRNQQGVLLPDAATHDLLTRENLARHTTIPYWNVNPGNEGIYNPITDELMIAGNCSGTQGVRGTGEVGDSWAGFIFYRDRADGNWKWRGITPFGIGTNESNIILTRDGRIRMDARQHRFTIDGARAMHLSSDATGSDWVETYLERGARPDQRVQGSVCRMAGGYGDPGLSVVVYANNFRSDVVSPGERRGLALGVSVDDGASFPWGFKPIYPEGPVTFYNDVYGNPLASPVTVPMMNTAYSTMCQLDAETVLIVYEARAVWPNGTSEWPYRVLLSQERNIRSLIA